MSFLNLALNESLQLEIKQKISSVQKITCITAIADKKKKIKWSLYICGVLIHLSLSLKLSSFFSLVLFSAEIHNIREKG